MCPACSKSGSSQRPACSDACAAALAKADKATDLIVRQSTQMAKASALGSYLCGGVMIVFAPFSLWMLPGLRVAPILLVLLGAAMVIMGTRYSKAAKQDG